MKLELDADEIKAMVKREIGALLPPGYVIISIRDDYSYYTTVTIEAELEEVAKAREALTAPAAEVEVESAPAEPTQEPL